MPETENPSGRRRGRNSSLLGNHLKAQCCANNGENKRSQPRNDPERDPLRESKSFFDHAPDCIDRSCAEGASARDGQSLAIPQPAEHLRQSSPLAVHQNTHAIDTRGQPQDNIDRQHHQRERKANLPCWRKLRCKAEGHGDRRGGRKHGDRIDQIEFGLLRMYMNIPKLSQTGTAASGAYCCSSCSVSHVAASPAKNVL